MLLAFRRSRRAAAVPLIPIALATGWSGGLIFVLGLLPGPLEVELNPMSVTLGALVIAISTEFSVLLSARYREERDGGASPERAIELTYASTGAAVLASGVTAIAGFAALIASNIRMLRDFGILTVVDLSVALLGVMLVLPAALVWAEQHGPFGLRDLDPRPFAARGLGRDPLDPVAAHGGAVRPGRQLRRPRPRTSRRRRRRARPSASRRRTASAPSPTCPSRRRAAARDNKYAWVVGHRDADGYLRAAADHRAAEHRRRPRGPAARQAAPDVRRPARHERPRRATPTCARAAARATSRRARSRPAASASDAGAQLCDLRERPTVLTLPGDQGRRLRAADRPGRADARTSSRASTSPS